MITRTHDREDRRVVWVGLTPAGRELTEQAIPVVTSFTEELAHAFGGGAGSRTVEVLGEACDQCMKIAMVPEDVRQDALRRLWDELTG